jgi:hypothetical protein
MANNPENAAWVPVRQLELGDVAEGGLGGVLNLPHEALTSRTAWLKAQSLLIGEARTVTVRHTFNPAVAGAPFILGDNARGHVVAGLNAEQLGGRTLGAVAKGSVVYATGANDLAGLAIGAVGQLLAVGAAGVPEWRALDLSGYAVKDGAGQKFTGSHVFERPAPDAISPFNVQVTGDAVSRLAFYAGGRVEWGPGGATVAVAARDLWIERGGAGLLKLGGALETTGAVSIAGAHPGVAGARLCVFGDANPAASQGVLVLASAAQPTRRIRAGVHGAGMLGFIQAVEDGQAALSLALQPQGGPVLIGRTDVDGTAAALQVNGYVSASRLFLNATDYVESLGAGLPLKFVRANGVPVGGKLGSLVLSDSFADDAPVNGLLSKGGVKYGDGSLQVSAYRGHISTRMVRGSGVSTGAIGAGAYYAVPWTGAAYDTAYGWGAGNPSRWTCTEVGIYQAHAQITYSHPGNVNGGTQVWIRKYHGGSYNFEAAVVHHTANPSTVSIAWEGYMELGAYLEVVVRNPSVTDYTVEASPGSWFTVKRVG